MDRQVKQNPKGNGAGRIRRRNKSYVDPTAMYVLAFIWCVSGIILVGFGALFLVVTLEHLTTGGRLPRQAAVTIIGFIGIPLGVIYWRAGFGTLKKRASGFKYATIACYAMLIKFPIGTLVGHMALKHLRANKEFYVRDMAFATTPVEPEKQQ